jgi:predicted anti-sigma-YlaC factor YlaD
MSKHSSEWLGAYLDGELHGSQLHHVQAHLAGCDLCRSELESLESLSSLLKEIPAPTFTPPERFAAQVSLRLPHNQTAVSRKQILEIGWWMIPVGLLAAWIFVSTSFFINDMLFAANTLGLLSGISDWLVFGSSGEAYWSATLGQFGILSGNSLDLAASTEAITRTSLPQISLQVSIALLYLSWIAIWWTRHKPRGHGQLLED